MSTSAHAKAAEPRIVEVYSSPKIVVDAKKANDTTKRNEEDVKNNDDVNIITKAGGEALPIIEDDKQKAKEEAERKAEEQRKKKEAEERKEKINGKVVLKYNMYAEEVTLCDPRMIHARALFYLLPISYQFDITDGCITAAKIDDE
jgi:hypothetical protein